METIAKKITNVLDEVMKNHQGDEAAPGIILSSAAWVSDNYPNIFKEAEARFNSAEVADNFITLLILDYYKSIKKY